MESFNEELKSSQFQTKLLQNKWSAETNMLEKVAKDQVIRGYFSDEEKEQDDGDLRYSCLKDAINEFTSETSDMNSSKWRRCSSFRESRPTLAQSKKGTTENSMVIMAVEGGEKKASLD